MALPFDLLIQNTSEVLTCDGPLQGPPSVTLAAIPGGAVGVSGGRIAWLGPAGEVPADRLSSVTEVVNAEGGFVGPGLIDCHTHVLSAGDRSDEFEQRCQGRSYLEIAAAGGGIARTIAATSDASEDELVRLALPRLDRLLAQGVTTVEVKSGYGRTAEDELKMLRAISRLGALHNTTVLPTFLGLHSLPAERSAEREAFIREMLAVLPTVAGGLARAVDVFVEQTAFSPEEARRFVVAARAVGLPCRLHVDQLTSGAGAELAAELGARTADHLEQVTPRGIAALAKAGTIAVLAPTSTLFARVKPYAPGRALREAGVPVALCTNCNPGSSASENVTLALGLSCLENGLTPAEAFLGFTRIAALAVGEQALGRLFVGGPADLIVSRAESYRQLPYHLAMNDTRAVLKRGRWVASNGEPSNPPRP